ncbi:tail protein X [Roseibium album]|uniref:tail protein X n=1 Tax=Roseibium album TaxID=311410 RepID=UPI0018CA3CB1|nr:phage tail protein X [Labrenzia sp. EL_126]
MPTLINVIGDNLTLDLLLWRQYGLRGLGLIEETMSLNPDVTSPFIASGTAVTLPDLPAPQPQAPRQVVTLFG